MCTIGTRTGNQVRTAGSFNGISKIFYRFIPVVRCIRIQRFLQPVTFDLIEGVVEEHAAGKSISQSDKDFLSRFFAHAFIGVMLDWIAAGMAEDPSAVVERVSKICEGQIDAALARF